MKKMKFVSFIGLVVASLLLGNIAYAKEDVRVIYNGTEVNFDVKPAIKEGRTLVPFRKVFELLGSEVVWNASTQTITANNGSSEIVLRIGDKTAIVNGVKKQLDVSPIIVNGRTVVPLRFVSENCGAQVDWVGESKTAYISTLGMTCH